MRIIISHSHLDHIGTLPVLMRRQPDARIFMTEATAEIGSALLHNSVSVMMRQREEIGVAIYPLFTHKETDRATDRWRWCPLGQPFTLEGERAKPHEAGALTVEFVDAGHVLGAAGVILRAEGRTIFYTGDVNFDDQTITKGAVFPESGVDVLIIETTRGDSPLPEGFTRAAEERRLAEAIERAFSRGGCILMPVFALGKTQEALAMIYKFRREKLLGDFPVYIGGLSVKMTEIYDRRAMTTRRLLPRLQLLEEVEPFVLNGQTIHDSPARRRANLRALQRNDDAQNALEYFRAARHRKSAAFDFLCRFCGPAIACGHSSRRPSPEILFRSIPMSPRSRCAARSSNSSSARMRRANRSSDM